MKKYELKDFMLRTNNEVSAKMDLLLDGKKTGHYLMVKGSEAKSVARAKINAQVAYADIAEKVKDIKDKAELIEVKRQLEEEAEIDYCLYLVTDWSFGEFDLVQLKTLLLENNGLALSVIGFSSTTNNYLAKK